jgi:hypothetical protein
MPWRAELARDRMGAEWHPDDPRPGPFLIVRQSFLIASVWTIPQLLMRSWLIIDVPGHTEPWILTENGGPRLTGLKVGKLLIFCCK